MTTRNVTGCVLDDVTGTSIPAVKAGDVVYVFRTDTPVVASAEQAATFETLAQIAKRS